MPRIAHVHSPTAPDVLAALLDASARPVSHVLGRLAGTKLTIEVLATAERAPTDA